MDYIDELFEGIEEDDRAERSVSIKTAADRGWAAVSEQEPPLRPQAQIQAPQRELLTETGNKVFVMKEGVRDWSLMMAVLFKGEDGPWLAYVSDNFQLAFRRFESRDEARYSRDRLTLLIRSNQKTVLYAGIRPESGKQKAGHSLQAVRV